MAVGKDCLDGEKRKPIVKLDNNKIVTYGVASLPFLELGTLSAEMFEDDWFDSRVDNLRKLLTAMGHKSTECSANVSDCHILINGCFCSNC